MRYLHQQSNNMDLILFLVPLPLATLMALCDLSCRAWPSYILVQAQTMAPLQDINQKFVLHDI